MATMEENVNPVEFTMDFKVTPEMIDKNHHMNNVWVVQWIQDIAIAHSDAAGSTALMEKLGCGWMVHTQYVEYKAQGFLGDEIRATTWVAGYSRLASSRKTKFVRLSDGKLLFESETQWVLVDVAKGRPSVIPEEMKNLFKANG